MKGDAPLNFSTAVDNLMQTISLGRKTDDVRTILCNLFKKRRGGFPLGAGSSLGVVRHNAVQQGAATDNEGTE